MRIPTHPDSGQQPTSDATPSTPPCEPAGASSARRHSFTVTSTGPTSASVLIDGHDIANGCAGLTLTMGVGQVPTVNLDLLILATTEIQDVQARILIPDATRDLLIGLGWTPPVEPSATSEAQPVTVAITEFLNVFQSHPSRGDYGWSWGCWGDGDCKGHVSYDISLRDYAERKAREHIAAEHAPTPDPAP